jgi:anthranilate phosphoribosyltransferase
MFQQLIEKLTRHEDLTTDEAAAAMAEIMEGALRCRTSRAC